MRQFLKQRLPRRWVVRARRLSRLRWYTKAQNMRHYGIRLHERPGTWLTHVLLDPEVESYTYDVANQDEMARFVAALVGVAPASVEEWLAEVHDEPELNERLRRRVRWRLDFKRRMPLGHRLAWYPLVRALKPAVVVETGIYAGLGSLVLLRALERNAAEGRPGRLISFDLDAESGWLVADHLRGRWERVIGPTEKMLDPALEGLAVDLFIHDTPHTEQLQRAEFAAALRHASARLVVVDSSGLQQPVLRELCAAAGVPHHHFRERPKDHFRPASGSGYAVFTRSSSA